MALMNYTVGTTLLLLASDALQTYQTATGATMDQTTGLLTVASESNLQSLFFNIGGVSTFLPVPTLRYLI